MLFFQIWILSIYDSVNECQLPWREEAVAHPGNFGHLHVSSSIILSDPCLRACGPEIERACVCEGKRWGECVHGTNAVCVLGLECLESRLK